MEWRKTPGGNRQGMVWGFELPQVINNPGVGAFLRGDKTPGVATKGDGVTGEDGRGRGGDGNPPHDPCEKGKQRQPQQRQHVTQAEDGGAADPEA